MSRNLHGLISTLKRCPALVPHVPLIWQKQAAVSAASSLAAEKAILKAEKVPDGGELDQIKAKIFGNRIGNGLRSGAKLLRRKLVGQKVASYYLTPIANTDPMFVDLRAEAKAAKLDKLKRRGKAPPKKGQGKRASGGKRKK